MKERYLNYNKVLKSEFKERIQKISIHAGFTCPNRDGSKGVGGCTYCNNQSFVPSYSSVHTSVTQQLDEGIAFFKHKYHGQNYLAYFQSYTNTYESMDRLIMLYEEALRHPLVKGIVVGTRPDCVSDELLDYFAQLSKRYYVMIEYGVESTKDETLEFINRGHTYACAVDAIQRTTDRGVLTGIHLIIGLPNETRETILEHAYSISKLPITMLKLHQLQLIRGTIMETQYIHNPSSFRFFTAEEYIELAIDFIECLNPTIAIERFVSQSPKEYILSTEWGVKNFEFVDKIEKRMIERDTWQGRLYNVNAINT